MGRENHDTLFQDFDTLALPLKSFLLGASPPVPASPRAQLRAASESERVRSYARCENGSGRQVTRVQDSTYSIGGVNPSERERYNKDGILASPLPDKCRPLHCFLFFPSPNSVKLGSRYTLFFFFSFSMWIAAGSREAHAPATQREYSCCCSA